MTPPPALREISPVLKQALELGPVLIYLVTYFMVRNMTVTLGGTDYGGFIIAVAIFTPIQLAAMMILRRLTGRLSRMQVALLVMVVVLGGITILLNDPTFFKIRSTLVFGSFGLLLFIGLWRGQSWLAYVLEGALPISQQGWMILTRRMAWFFMAFAAANEVVWRNFSDDVYVIWDTAGQMGVMFAFLLSNLKLIERHWVEPAPGPASPSEEPKD